MTVSMVARAFYVLVVALIVLCLRRRSRCRARRRLGALRTFIQEGASQVQRQRRRRVRAAVLSDFAPGGEGVSTVPWPDRGTPNCSGRVACLVPDEDAVTTPFGSQSLLPRARPAALPENQMSITGAQALRALSAGGDARDKENIILAEAWPLPAMQVSHA